MDPGAESGDGGGFLTASQSAGRDEHAKVFAVQATGLPQAAEAVDEGLPLRRVVAVSGGDAKEESVVVFDLIGRDDGDALVGGRSVHLGQDFCGQGLFDPAGREAHVSRLVGWLGKWLGLPNVPVDIGTATSGFDASLLSCGQFGNVAPCRVLYG